MEIIICMAPEASFAKALSVMVIHVSLVIFFSARPNSDIKASLWWKRPCALCPPLRNWGFWRVCIATLSLLAIRIRFIRLNFCPSWWEVVLYLYWGSQNSRPLLRPLYLTSRVRIWPAAKVWPTLPRSKTVCFWRCAKPWEDSTEPHQSEASPWPRRSVGP